MGILGFAPKRYSNQRQLALATYDLYTNFYSTKLDIKSNCLHCMIPSSDRSVNDFLYSSFSQPSTEKSDSTVAVLGKIVAIPPQKSLRTLNLLAPSTIDQPDSNEVLPSHPFSADFSEGSC